MRPIEMVTRIGGSVVEVRLHRNIEQVEDEDGTHWEADEVHGTVPVTTSVAYVDARFDDLWDEWDDTPLTRRIADVRDATDVQGDAIAEVAEMSADSAEQVEVLAGAIAELAEIVAGGE